MNILNIEQDKCVKCGACAASCPVSIILIDKDLPYEVNSQNCLQCGHCVAVCPTNALDNLKTPIQEQATINDELVLDSDKASQFLRARRSIRSYKNEKVSQEKLLKLLDVARFAHTAGNRQGISFMVISDEEKLKKIGEVTVDFMIEQEKAASNEKGLSSKFSDGNIRKHFEKKILWNAPHLIVALSPKNDGGYGQLYSQLDAAYILSYAELFAPTIDLGTCWAGLVQNCGFSGYAPLYELLDIADDKMIAGAIMVGYPKYKYHRLVNRKPLNVLFR